MLIVRLFVSSPNGVEREIGKLEVWTIGGPVHAATYGATITEDGRPVRHVEAAHNRAHGAWALVRACLAAMERGW